MWSRWFFHKLKSVEKLLYVWGKFDIVLFASFLFLLIIFPSNGYAAISKANPYELGNLSLAVFKKASAFCAKAQGALRRQSYRHGPPRRGCVP
ncbi:hypothetical protein F2Q69_00013571 [Brassica cretica]|uniref:Uncharacterized protein n=1 Tax=Brassica cretica TaxID=69181 RepID=A0A8S9QUK9_BRACR|nr:hypothetical protein F2Q69_00013571 [Brassica cretica]